MRSRSRRAVLGVALALVAVATTGRAAEPALAWSQSDVVALTAQLSSALDDLLVDPGLHAHQGSAYQQRKHDAAIATVKEAKPRVDELRRRVAAGYDLEESRPYFERVVELRGEIASYASQSWLPESARKKAGEVGSLLDRLSRYYQARR